MKETPITLPAGCVQTIAAGRKTMLRSVAANPYAECPLGRTGDRLQVRDSPLLLEIEHVRLERLQEIEEEELDAEGGMWREFHGPGLTPVAAFGRWWDSLHTRPGTRWQDDPWVWVVSFRKV